VSDQRVGVAKSTPLRGRVLSGEQLILVDEQDREHGVQEKLQAHVEGALHRAFSIFVFDSEKRLLLQKRAQSKYHSGGLWSNTACGHPRPGESTLAAARRRLREEMGFDCALRRKFGFLYRVELENRLVEHEYDHVFAGDFNGDPMPNISEVESWRWISMSQLRQAVCDEPDEYSYWLRVALDREEWHDALA
jgi:isopentenyl-diphosphate delta-isomerase